MARVNQFIIEICSPDSCMMFLQSGEDITPEHDAWDDIADCCTTGDCVAACEYINSAYGVDYRIVADDGNGYVNRDATDSELQACCEAIYFESITDFTDRDSCEMYLIWQATCDIIERQNEQE